MTFKKGNTAWKARTKHGGAGRAFKTPDILWEACLEYFDWVTENPLTEQRLVTHLGEYKRVDMPKMRMMTIEGLCVFLGVGTPTWHEYKKHVDYKEVCLCVEEIMLAQAVEGAAAKLLDSGIVARKLGLKEYKETTGPNGGPVVTTIRLDPKSYRRVREQMLREDDC